MPGHLGLSETLSVVEAPETGYAETPSGKVAYERAGGGSLDVLGVKPSMIPVDLMWEEPGLAAFLGRLSGFSRHIWFDQRGSGASHRPNWDAGRFVEDIVDDMVAVLDELGCEQAAIVGAVGPPELLFAASHPARTKALVLINAFARARQTIGHPGLSEAEMDALMGTTGAHGEQRPPYRSSPPASPTTRRSAVGIPAVNGSPAHPMTATGASAARRRPTCATCSRR